MERLYKYGITREIRGTREQELIKEIKAMIEAGYSTEEIKEVITKIIERKQNND